jgi:transposase-like protein
MTKAQQKRLVNWRLKVLRHEREVTQNISRTCRHFGVSRRWFYKWSARYAAHGEAGLCDQSTVHRILQRHGMARLPANQKHRQHTKRGSATRSSSPATGSRWT